MSVTAPGGVDIGEGGPDYSARVWWIRAITTRLHSLNFSLSLESFCLPFYSTMVLVSKEGHFTIHNEFSKCQPTNTEDEMSDIIDQDEKKRNTSFQLRFTYCYILLGFYLVCSC